MAADVPNLVTEGLAKTYLPKGVFYNPVQEFNRDLTINVISEYGRITREEKANKKRKQLKKTTPENSEIGFSSEMEREEGAEDGVNVRLSLDTDDIAPGVVHAGGLRILEALAASGLRSVRFCKEMSGIKEVVANDYSYDAVETMKKNIELNDVQNLMTASCDDAAMLMYKASRDKKKLFDVIDLDPYGGPTLFLDSAVQAVKDGGLLCVTCTDMAILCGNASEKCFAAYGAMSLKSKSCHEIALRIVLRTIDSYANRYAKYIVPLLSVSVDFYCRVFVRVYSGPQKVKESASKSAMLYECSGCSAHYLQPLGRIVESVLPDGQVHKKFTFATAPSVNKLCCHCNHPHHIGGPLWSAPIHDINFVNRLISRVRINEEKFGTSKRVIGMMTLISEELPDVPLYYLPDKLSSVIHSMSPGFLPIRSAILHAGYRVSLSHAAINSIKTDAPPSVLWDIMRCWAKIHTINEKRIIQGTPCAFILGKEPELAANFELHENAEPESKKLGLLRYQNGKKDWGPKAKATNDFHDQTEKRKQNQNKRANKRLKKDIDEGRYKQHYCANFRKTGSCNYGDECKYSHDIPVDEATPTT